MADVIKSLAHWGNSSITGRGLLALAGRGSIAQVVLDSEESYIAHPRYVKRLEMDSRAHTVDTVMSLPTQ